MNDPISLIKQSLHIKTVQYIDKLICKCGLYGDPKETPEEIKAYCGYGLEMWQYPRQMAHCLSYILTNYNIHTFLEIGTFKGGNFIFWCEMLKKYDKLACATTVDIKPSTEILTYMATNPNILHFTNGSMGEDFHKYIEQKEFDLIYIDGDHSYNGVKYDFELLKNKGKHFIFHDIVNQKCPGVVRFWNELKADNNFHCVEFTEQYPSFVKRKESYLGIGFSSRLNLS